MRTGYLRHTALALCVLMAAACQTPTPYQPAVTPNGDGYTTQQIESNRFRVSFKGNSLTNRQTVDTYMLYRAAEVTLQNGGDYFIVVNKDLCKAGTPGGEEAAKGVVKFIEYGLGAGQSILKEADYAKLPAPILSKSEAAVKTLECNGSPIGG